MELGEICRTCLRRGQPVSPLFEESKELFTLGKPLVEFVNMFTEIMLFPTEGFPEQICTTCLNDIKRAYAFKLRCECSETTLHHLKETNSILNLENLDFDAEFTKLNEQLFHDKVKDDILMDTSTEEAPELTNSIMNLLQVEPVVEDELDPNYQAELDAILERQMFMKSVLECTNIQMKDEGNRDNQEEDTRQVMLCSACPETFPSRDLLKTHVIDFHTDGKLCILCNEEFECMKAHSEKHLLPRLQCSHCDQKFEYRPLLVAHLRTHMIPNEETGKLEFKCDRCTRSFSAHHEFMTHKRAHAEDRPFSCETCGMAFKRRDKLKAHMTSHSDERPFECTLCQSRFKRKDNLTSHLKAVHQQGGKVYKCNVCEKAFRFKDKLKAHMNTHLRLFSCELCHAGFPRKESLDRHIEQKHKADGTAILKTTDSIQSSRVDLEPKTFPCSVCNKEFNLQEALTSHMKTHVKKVELKCDLCLKIFTQSNKLKSHMITHTDLRPYQCTFCPSLFKRKDNLNRHMKKHNRSKGGSEKKLKKIESQKNCENNANCDNVSTDRIDESQLNEISRVDSIEMEANTSAITGKIKAIASNVQNKIKSLKESHAATADVEEEDKLLCNESATNQRKSHEAINGKANEQNAEGLVNFNDNKTTEIIATLGCNNSRRNEGSNISTNSKNGPNNEAQIILSTVTTKKRTNPKTLSDSYTIANLLRKNETQTDNVNNFNKGNCNSPHSINCSPGDTSHASANHLKSRITISNHTENSNSRDIPNNHLNHTQDILSENSIDNETRRITRSELRCLRNAESV